MLLLRFPSEIIVTAILPFLSWKEIARLDSSVVVHEQRSEWLQTLSTLRCFTPWTPRTIDRQNFSALKWACCKRIGFSSITIYGDTDNQMIESLLHTNYDWMQITRFMVFQNSLDGGILSKFLLQMSGVQELTIETSNAAASMIAIRTARKLVYMQIASNAAQIVFELISQCHPDLQEFGLTAVENVSDRHATACLQRMTNFRSISIRNYATDNMLSALAMNGSRLRKARIQSRCPSYVTDEGIKLFAAGCSGMQDIELAGICTITEKSLLYLSESGKLLTKLTLINCGEIAELGLSSIGRNCALLVELLVYECGDVTDAGIMAVVDGCPLLQSIDVSPCKVVTDAALLHLAMHCTHLSSLCVRSGKLLTNVSVSAVFARCTKLEHFTAFNCPLLTVACLYGLDRRQATGPAGNHKKMTASFHSNNITVEDIARFNVKYPFLKLTA